MKRAHLARDLCRFARAHYLARRRAVEHVDRAERAGANAAPARQDRHRALAEDQRRVNAAVRIRKFVEIARQRPQRGSDGFIALAIRKSRDAAPRLTRPEAIGEFEQCQFAFEAHDAVELGHQRQRVLMAKAREMAAHRKVGIDTVGAEPPDQLREALDVKLENQREADDERVCPLDRREDDVKFILHIEDVDLVAPRPQGVCEIAKSEIALLLETDEDHAARAIPGPRGRACKIVVNGGSRAHAASFRHDVCRQTR